MATSLLRSIKKKLSIPRTVITIVLAWIVIVLFMDFGKDVESKLYPKITRTPKPVATNVITVNGVDYTPKTKITSTLVMGIDKFGEQADASANRNNEQADFLVLLVFDKSDNSLSALHINRDTITSVPILAMNGRKAGRAVAQIAVAHTYGKGVEDSCENTVQAVTDLLYGVSIDHYFSISMDAVAILNDMVGGVPVKIEDDFSNVDASLVQGETVTLMGNQALTFVRARSSMEDPSNLARMKRQRAYISSWIQQAQLAHAENRDTTKYKTQLLSYVITDLSVNKVQQMMNELTECDAYRIYTISGTSGSDRGYAAFYVDEDDLRQKVLTLFYNKVTK